MNNEFLHVATRQYHHVNTETLRWMLARARFHGALVNTKFDSLHLMDRPREDLWRGPRTQYGWIQGRALEALLEHARDYTASDPAFAETLRNAARELYNVLAALYDRDGHGYFTYNERLHPVYRDALDMPQTQHAPSGSYTYSDVFFLKGLFAAACEFDPDRVPKYATDLLSIVDAIEQGRFVINERQPLAQAAGTSLEYGPRMIMLGAAALLKSRGQDAASAFGERFISHVLTHHRTPDGLLLDEINGESSNLGHAIEFVGFSLEYLGDAASPDLVRTLQDVLLRSFTLGFQGDGLAMTYNARSKAPINALKPWWSLPETIRAAALTYRYTGSEDVARVWREAHDAFFTAFWRADAPVAYQMRDDRGPVDVAPATPDLDPSYHTGLSLRAAMHVARELIGLPERTTCSTLT